MLKSLIVSPLLLAFVFSATFSQGCSRSCGRLRKYGFDYEIIHGASSSWQTAIFYSKGPDGDRVAGPTVTGDLLKVICEDIDKDGLSEFVIKSKVYKTYQTILKVNLDSKSYHVYSTNGLKVDYPKEGYHYH